MSAREFHDSFAYVANDNKVILQLMEQVPAFS